MNDLPRRKKVTGLRAFALLMLAMLLLGGLAGLGSAFLGDRPGVVGLGLTIAIAALAMALGFIGCIWWWRQIDEAAKEAHKWAWWWGGSGGMALGSVFLLTLMLRADTQPLPAGFGSTPSDIFVSGMMSILVFQMAGYLVAWAGWWLKHR